MKSIEIKNGSKVATVKEGLDGYGEKVFKVAAVQYYFDGLQTQERFIASKNYATLRGAKAFANRMIA